MEKGELLRGARHQGRLFLLTIGSLTVPLTDGFLTEQQRCRHQSMGFGWSRPQGTKEISPGTGRTTAVRVRKDAATPCWGQLFELKGDRSRTRS
jgi:hypothetical protein